MARTHAAPAVPVKVLVKEKKLAPVGIARIARLLTVARAALVTVHEKERRKAPRQLDGHRRESEPTPGARRAFDAQVGAVEVVVTLERLDEQIVHRKPNGATPIRVAAEERRRRIA